MDILTIFWKSSQKQPEQGLVEQCWHTFGFLRSLERGVRERDERQICKEGGKSGEEGGNNRLKRMNEFPAHAEDTNMHINYFRGLKLVFKIHCFRSSQKRCISAQGNFSFCKVTREWMHNPFGTVLYLQRTSSLHPLPSGNFSSVKMT